MFSIFSNPRGAAHSCGPLFDLELFSFLVSVEKLEGPPLQASQADRCFSLQTPLFFFPDRTRPEKREDRAPKCSTVPIVAALRGLATGVSVSASVLRLSLSVCVHGRGLSLSLCLCVGSTLPVSYQLSI